MANANPSNKYERNVNAHNDRSPIRKADGQHVIKAHCVVCETTYKYDEIDGDPGCLQCDVNMAVKQEKINRLKRLADEAESLEKENAEYLKEEKALKARIAKAKGLKKS